jgi:endonuclease YncB( thermonuclease family)
MRWLASALFLLFCLVSSQAQNDSAQKLVFEYEAECGRAGYESSFWLTNKGRVTKIFDGDSIEIKIPMGKKVRVDLVSIDASQNKQSAQCFLEKNLINQDVEFSTSMSFADYKQKRIDAIVYLQSQDINRKMIENGLAQHKAPKSYSVSDYTNCLYIQLEKKARAAKIGIWANETTH